jgi:molybdenum cofactor synthesis domain-containing protein
MSVKIELVCIGNELLIGKTVNTNAHWLAERCTALGASVRRITVISDDLDEIAGALNESLRRKPSFIITTGGLGPTFDDKTLRGVSRAVKMDLEVNQKALNLVRSKYESLLRERRIERVDMTPARVKMATFPKGAEPLPNPVGTAPGMLLKARKTWLVALPGVPPEMEAIFEDSMVPMIKKKVGKSAFYEASIFLDGIMESALAPLIDKVMHDNQHVYVKSHVYSKTVPQVEGKTSHIEIHFSTTAESPRNAKNYLNNAIAELSDLARESGGTVKG